MPNKDQQEACACPGPCQCGDRCEGAWQKCCCRGRARSKEQEEAEKSEKSESEAQSKTEERELLAHVPFERCS